jgi:hypothetical protein
MSEDRVKTQTRDGTNSEIFMFVDFVTYGTVNNPSDDCIFQNKTVGTLLFLFIVEQPLYYGDALAGEHRHGT